MTKFLVSFTGLMTILSSVCAGQTVDFEDLTEFTHNGETGSYFNGSRDGSTNSSGWWSKGVHFGNEFSSDFGGFWTGWSYSTVSDSATGDFTNQYAAVTGSGFEESSTYAVGFSGEMLFFNLPDNQNVNSVQVTNTTYTHATVKEGNQFSKKFGGATGTDEDFFSVTFTGMDGLNGDGSPTGQTEFFLADYRFPNNDHDFVLETWQEVDLTSLGDARSVRLTFESSDVGPFGINTPQYVAIDNLELIASNDTVGDFNGDGQLGAADIDALTDAVHLGDPELIFDLNDDGRTDLQDRTFWVHDLKQTFFGDADLDGEFSTTDLTTVFQAAEYEDATVHNSGWSDGDWDGDRDFGTRDLVLAFQDGGFESGPRAAARLVPEPHGLVLISSLLLAIFSRVRVGNLKDKVYRTVE